MLQRQGKLITLATPTLTPAAERADVPMSLLPFYFHVIPEEYRVSGSGNHSSQNIIRYGEVSQFGGRSLKTVSWQSMFAVREWIQPNVEGFTSFEQVDLGAHTVSEIEYMRDSDGQFILDANGNRISASWVYERNNDGSIAMGSDGTPMFRLNANGERIPVVSGLTTDVRINRLTPTTVVQEEYPSWVLPPTVPSHPFFGAFESIELLEQIRDGGHVVSLTIHDLEIEGANDLNQMLATVRDFEWWETAGEPDARYYSISFTEYRPVRLRMVDRVGAVPEDNGSRTSGPWHDTYTVPKDGMGIGEVAMAVYKSYAAKVTIFKANGERTGMARLGAANHAGDKFGPWYFKKGTKLKTPKLPKPKKTKK